MAGIKQEKITYLKVTCGRMISKKDGVILKDFGGYKGHFLGIREKIGEFEGQKTVAIEVKMKDTESEEIVIIQFTKKGLFAKGFFSCIRKVDLKKPFTMLVWGSDKNEKISFCGLQQDGYQYVENRKTIEPDKSFPSYKEVVVSGEKTADWTEPLAAMDAIVKNINENMATVAPKAAEAEAVLESTPEADLPF